MNTSYKCNCCAKESVCKYSEEYKHDCAQIQKNIVGKKQRYGSSARSSLPSRRPSGRRRDDAGKVHRDIRRV